jgi:hypothetical protein
MTFWNVGDEESKDRRFCAAGPAGFGLYHLAGSWCLGEHRFKRDLPAEWFIPDWWVASHPSGTRTAKLLVAQRLWKRLDGGYGFAWIRECNTPDAVRRLRKRELNKKRTRSAGEHDV